MAQPSASAGNAEKTPSCKQAGCNEAAVMGFRCLEHLDDQRVEWAFDLGYQVLNKVQVLTRVRVAMQYVLRHCPHMYAARVEDRLAKLDEKSIDWWSVHEACPAAPATSNLRFLWMKVCLWLFVVKVADAPDYVVKHADLIECVMFGIKKK